MSEADAANWAIEDALGSTSEAFADTPDVPDATTLAPGQTANSSFGFNGLPSPAAQAPSAAPQATASGPQWVQSPTSFRLVSQAASGPQVGQSMTGYDPYQASPSPTGIRVAQTGEAARRSHGTPEGDVAYSATGTGYRVTSTGKLPAVRLAYRLAITSKLLTVNGQCGTVIPKGDSYVVHRS